MVTTCPEKLSVVTNRTELIKEQLAQGKEAANQLSLLIQKPLKDVAFHVLAEDLAARILKSFTYAISELSSVSGKIDLDQHHLGTLREDRKSEGTSESSKRPAPKDKRGCYKRRKNGQTTTVYSSSIEDGMAWRKYGQKNILNSRYPRAYFRCTRKYDKGCKAIKQVERVEGSPQRYQMTYIGNHTCKDVLMPPQFITDSDPWKSMSISCGTNISSCEQEYHQDESKEEIMLMTPDCSNNNNNDISSSIDSMTWPQIPDMFLMESSDLTFISDNMGSYYSNTDTSSHSLDVDGCTDIDPIWFFR